MNSLFAARLLVIATFLALMRSPPLANLCLLSLLILVVATADLRSRLALAWRQPMTRGAALLGAVLALGVTYSEGGWRDGWNQLWAWRTLFFMVLVSTLFDDERWKRIGLRALATSTALVALAALILSAWQARSLGLQALPPVMLVRNYATQGMTFTTALVACAMLLRLDPRRLRLLWAGCALVLLLSITLVTEGRSGYLVLLASAGVFTLALLLHKGLSLPRALLAGTGTVALGLALVALSPVARQRIELGITEVRSYQQQTTEGTSMGLRMIFWQDAIALIREKPVLGWGTGSYGAAQRQWVSGRSGAAARETVDPHNQYLKIAAETGLVGVAALLVFLASLLRQRPSAPYRIAGLSILAGWCATSLANSHFSTFQEGHLLFLWLGLTLAHERASPATPAGTGAAG